MKMYSHANGNQLQILLAFLLFVTLTSSKDGNTNIKGILDKILSHGENSYPSSKFRQKRSECSKGTWTLDASCNCCQNYCTQRLLSEAYSNTHGSCTVGNVCCLTKQNPIQWTQNCSATDWSFSVKCSCSASLGDYYCTCEQGYNVSTCAASQRNADLLTTVYVLVPLLLMGIILAVLTYGCLRNRRHKQYKNKFKQNNMSAKYMKGNILITVGNRDELKIYSEQLTSALETLGGTRNRMNVKTIGIFQFYIAEYIVEFDKVVFLLDTDKSTDHRVNICIDKVIFRRRRPHSVAVIYFDRTGKQSGLAEGTDNTTGLNEVVRSNKDVKDSGSLKYDIQSNEICFDNVSSIKEIEKWLPFVTRIIFNINRKLTTEHNLFSRKQYFIKRLVESTDTPVSYLQKLNNILVLCGARKAQSEEHAKCKILVVNSFNELTRRNIHECENCYLFSATNYKPNADIHQSMITYMYCREQVMTGIFTVLLQLHIIK